MPDDHSEVEPLLPIPNRTVKRFSADDSEHLARESRTSSGKLLTNPQASNLGVCSFVRPPLIERAGGSWILYARLRVTRRPRLWSTSGPLSGS